MHTPIFTRRFFDQYKRCRYVSDFDAMLWIKCSNTREYNRILNVVMNSSPFLRSITPESLQALACRNKKGADQIVRSIIRVFCEEYEAEYDFVMSHRYVM